MDPILDRRDDRSARVRVRLAVELGQGDFRDAFEADALNVSKGGISVRAACLPDLHSRLLCRFQCAPGGASVTALGEVVWAHLDGDQRGEFGLAFVDLDPKTEWLIEEMIAEHAVRRSGRGVTKNAGARVATLELEGSPEPIAAHVARSEGGRAVFEQALDLLSLGRGVLANAEGWEERSGRIAGVELRMVGSVPMLAVTVSFQPRKPEQIALALPEAGDELAHDTEPDLNAPPPEAASAQRFGVTVAEFGGEAGASARAQRAEGARTAAAQPPPAWALSPLDHPPPSAAYDEDAEPELELEHAHVQQAHAPAAAAAESNAAPARESLAQREFSRAFKLDDGAEAELDSELDSELEAFAGPSYKPLLLAAWRGLKASLGALAGMLGAGAASSSRAAAPKLRGAFLRGGSALSSLYGREIGLRVGAARRLVGAALPARRRRTTAGPMTAAKKKPSGSLGRTLLLGMLAAGAAGLAVYAFVPSKHADGLDLHRKLQPLPGPNEEANGGGEAEVEAPQAEAAAPVVAKPLPAPATALAPSAGGPQPARAVAANANLPSAARVPASSPFAVDVRATAQSAKPEMPRNKLRFGADKVSKGRRFSLRMSARVQSIEGVPDKGGFTVSIPGCLSLDRAGPISSAVKSVKRAMVVNKGDHAELSIRFVDGKQPTYQVSAEGTTLYLLIEDLP